MIQVYKVKHVLNRFIFPGSSMDIEVWLLVWFWNVQDVDQSRVGSKSEPLVTRLVLVPPHLWNGGLQLEYSTQVCKLVFKPR